MCCFHIRPGSWGKKVKLLKSYEGSTVFQMNCDGVESKVFISRITQFSSQSQLFQELKFQGFDCIPNVITGTKVTCLEIPSSYRQNNDWARQVKMEMGCDVVQLQRQY